MRTLILFLLFIPVLNYGQPIVWDGNTNCIEIGDKLEILEDAKGILSYEEVASENFINKFQKSDNLILSLGYTDSFFWLRFSIDNQSEDYVMLELSQAGLPLVDLYLKVDDLPVKHTVAGYNVHMLEKDINSSYQVFAIPPGKVDCYIRINSNSEPIPVHLYNVKTFELKSTSQKISYGIYLGLMIFVVLYNIFLFISLRKRLYLFYAFIVMVYICYSAAVIDGFIVYFIPGLNLKFWYTTIPAIGITLQTFYCLVFLEVKKFSLKTYKTVMIFVLYFGMWMIAKFFFAFPIVQPINTVNALLSFSIMGFVGVKVGANGNKMGYYFAIAYFIYFILVAVQAIYINTGSPHYFGGLSYVAYATLIEAFLLSFLLTRRYEWEKEEIEHDKFEAQWKVIEKTQENERIIREQKDKLEKEVAARTAQLQAKNNKLIDLNREKDGLVNVVAHDLRSPLCSIIAFADLIKREGALSEEQIKYLASINKVLDGGMQLIDDLLDVHTFEFGEAKIELAEINVQEYLSDWIKTFNSELKRKEQNLILNINVTNPNFNTSNALLTRILNNLMSNAIKFSEKKKTIYLSVFESDSTCDFSLRDEGPGISEADQKKMFKQFQKLSARPTDGESSNGLGLSIIETLTRKLRGQIIVTSELGTGTDFTIKFPKFSN